jgi:hypothetical protein
MFTVEFTPREAGPREAQKTIVVNVEGSPLVLEREIRLRGEGIPGRLVVSPSPICFALGTTSRIIGGRRCLIHVVTITNTGAGEVTVRDIRIAPLGSPYQIVSISPPDYRDRPLGVGGSITVELSLCDLTITTNADLLIDSDAADPAIAVRILGLSCRTCRPEDCP